eukprot:5350537-Heterocapsa_arctica.AAC.1
MAYATAFELFLDYGNDRYSKIFDKQMERLNTNKTAQYYIMLSEINCTTKANIIQSILGLGHALRQQRHPELTDLPDNVNFLETELRFFNMRLCAQSPRAAPAGQEPFTGGQRGHDYRCVHEFNRE